MPLRDGQDPLLRGARASSAGHGERRTTQKSCRCLEPAFFARLRGGAFFLEAFLAAVFFAAFFLAGPDFAAAFFFADLVVAGRFFAFFLADGEAFTDFLAAPFFLADFLAGPVAFLVAFLTALELPALFVFPAASFLPELKILSQLSENFCVDPRRKTLMALTIHGKG